MFHHVLDLLRAEASRYFTGTARIKIDGFATDILHSFVIAVCLYESFIMHLHCVLPCFRPPKGGGSRSSTGTVRIKSDGFARDILQFFVIEVCLYESFIMHLHCVLSCFRPPKG